MEQRIKDLESKLAEMAFQNQQLESEVANLKAENEGIINSLSEKSRELEHEKKRVRDYDKWWQEQKDETDRLNLLITSLRGILLAFDKK